MARIDRFEGEHEWEPDTFTFIAPRVSSQTKVTAAVDKKNEKEEGGGAADSDLRSFFMCSAPFRLHLMTHNGSSLYQLNFYCLSVAIALFGITCI